MDDASVTALVKSTLLHHRSTSALKTTVETREGTVELGVWPKTQLKRTWQPNS